jgi:hypothetical protein
VVTRFDLALAAILSLPGTGAPADRPRLEQLAGAIVAAVEDREHAEAWVPGSAPMPFTPELSTLSLVAIAWHEGGFREAVSDCRITGDRLPGVPLHAGRAIGDFQLQRVAWAGHSRRDICRDVRLSARLALAHLARQSRRSPAATFGGYAGRIGKASRETCAIWKRLAERAGLAAKCD